MQFPLVTRNENNYDISLFVSGDFCPVKCPENMLVIENTIETFLGDLCETIKNADFSITNLECPLTLADDAIEKIGPNLRAHPDTAAMLSTVGFNMVTLANNHIYDFGQQGLFDTLESLKKNALAYVGAGLDLKEAQRIFYLEIKGIRLAIINIAEVEFSSADIEHGGANPMDLIDNFHQIQDARNNADHVIVIVHGGHEHYHYPSPKTLKRYRFYAESGASAVIAHHTHCIGGYELFKSVPIFYSLGNFFFPAQNKNTPSFWNEGYALLLKISKETLLFDIMPYEQCKNGSWTINRIRSKELLEKIGKINLVLNDDRQIEANWKKFIEERNSYYLTKISGLGRYTSGILRRLSLLKFFYRKSQLNNVRQMIQCKAHKEAAISVLSNYLKYHG